MIDMVFLLLVFFMTVSTLAKEARPEINLPYSTAASVPIEQSPRQILTLESGAEGLLFHYFNRTVGPDTLRDLLKSHAEEDWLVRAPPDVIWEQFHEVLGKIRACGVHKTTLATYEE